MLHDDGTISFVTEIMQAVDDFAREVEATQGPLQNELERGLVMSFALGALRHDLEALWDTLESSAPLGALDCRAVFEECLADGTPLEERQQAIRDLLQQRGWLPRGEA